MIPALDHLSRPTPLKRWLLEAGKDAARGNSASKFDPQEAGGQPNKRAGVIR